jgi:hypothetical protein
MIPSLMVNSFATSFSSWACLSNIRLPLGRGLSITLDRQHDWAAGIALRTLIMLHDRRGRVEHALLRDDRNDEVCNTDRDAQVGNDNAAVQNAQLQGNRLVGRRSGQVVPASMPVQVLRKAPKCHKLSVEVERRDEWEPHRLLPLLWFLAL